MVVYYGPPDINWLKEEIKKLGNSSMVSQLEKRVLDKLYKEYQNTGKLFRWKTTDAFNELGIRDGAFIGTLNDSKYIKIENEHFVITSEGIRYMENSRDAKEEIVKLAPEFHGIGLNLKALWKKIWKKK